MTYQLAYTAQAKSQIQDLPNQKIKDQIEKALLRLSGHPDLGKRLQGELSELYSYPTGKYRIIYQLIHSQIKILVIAVGSRKDVYRKL